jgi:hypothetical protein
MVIEMSGEEMKICPLHHRELYDSGWCRDCGCNPDIKKLREKVNLINIDQQVLQICKLLKEIDKTSHSGKLKNGWSYKFEFVGDNQK